MMKQVLFEVVNSIPVGKVCYYGQVADVVTSKNGSRITAQMIGWTLSGMKEDEYEKCAWQRVVAKNGFLSTLKLGNKGILQKKLLEDEKVEINEDYVDMSKHCLTLDKLRELNGVLKEDLEMGLF